jgi:thiol-disulfide isomerase/thioredoxin
MGAVKRTVLMLAALFGISGNLIIAAQDAGGPVTGDFDMIVHAGDERFPFDGLLTVDGEAFDGVMVKDKYVLVTLWSTWCPYCDKENPSIQELYEKYAGSGFTVLTISLGEEEGTVKEYMGSKGYTFPVLMDREEKLKERYAPRRPRSYVVDSRGNIVREIRGDREWVSGGAVKALGNVIPGFGERD